MPDSLPLLSVAFVDFWSSFDVENNFIIRILRRHYDVRIDCRKPDVVFYSCFGFRHLRYADTLRIYYTWENVVPNFNICDFAISCNRIQFENRHLYLPYALIAPYGREQRPLPPLTQEMARRKFCSFIYSNNKLGRGSQLRQEFCRRLMEYQHVDCPGAVLHNMDAPELAGRADGANWNDSKIRFIGQYKFNIAFENCSTPGYITEKLTDAYYANTVPIYWGSEGDISPFPRESAIIADEYDSLESLLQRIREVNEDDDLYMSMLAANPLRHGMRMDSDEVLENFILESLQHRPLVKSSNTVDLEDYVQLGLTKLGKGKLRMLERMAGIGCAILPRKLRNACNMLKSVLREPGL